MKINDILIKEDNSGLDAIVDKIKSSYYFKNTMYPEMARLVNNVLDEDPRDMNDSTLMFLLQSSDLLYHGSPRISDGVSEIKFKERAKPKDSSILAHNYVNALAEEKFGRKVRNGMFGTVEYTRVETYGNGFLIIPLGKYSVYYVPGIMDFTGDLNASYHNAFGASFIADVSELMISMYTKKSGEILDVFKTSDTESIMDSIEDGIYDIREHSMENIHTFDELYNTIDNICRQIVKELNIDDDERKGIYKHLKVIYQQAIENKKNGLKEYVDNMRETTNLNSISDDELMIWFDKAIVIPSSSDDGKHIIKLLFEYVYDKK